MMKMDYSEVLAKSAGSKEHWKQQQAISNDTEYSMDSLGAQKYNLGTLCAIVWRILLESGK